MNLKNTSFCLPCEDQDSFSEYYEEKFGLNSMARAMVFRTSEQIHSEFIKKALVFLSKINVDVSLQLEEEYKRRAKDFMDKASQETPERVDPPLMESFSPPSSLSYVEQEIGDLSQPFTFEEMGNENYDGPVILEVGGVDTGIDTLLNDPVLTDTTVDAPVDFVAGAPTKVELSSVNTPDPTKPPDFDVYEFKDDSSSDNDEVPEEIQMPPTTTVGLEVFIRTTKQKPPPVLRMDGLPCSDTQKPSSSQKKGKPKHAKKPEKYQSIRKTKDTKVLKLSQEAATQSPSTSQSQNTDKIPSSTETDKTTNSEISPFAMFRQLQSGRNLAILDIDAVESFQLPAACSSEHQSSDIRPEDKKLQTKNLTKFSKGAKNLKLPATCPPATPKQNPKEKSCAKKSGNKKSKK